MIIKLNETEEKRAEALIRKAIKENNGIFDRDLKNRIQSIFQKRFKSKPEEWNLIVPYEPSKQEIADMSKLYNIDPDMVTVTLDTHLIGGFIFKSQSKRIDGSLAGNITNLAQTL